MLGLRVRAQKHVLHLNKTCIFYIQFNRSLSRALSTNDFVTRSNVAFFSRNFFLYSVLRVHPNCLWAAAVQAQHTDRMHATSCRAEQVSQEPVRLFVWPIEAAELLLIFAVWQSKRKDILVDTSTSYISSIQFHCTVHGCIIDYGYCPECMPIALVVVQVHNSPRAKRECCSGFVIG